MKLQFVDRFKTALIGVTLVSVVSSSTFVATGGLDSLNKMRQQDAGSREQALIVENSINSDYNSDSEYVPKYDFDKLREINPNIIGVIEGDIFENGYYPVVDSNSFDDVNYNLEHSVDGSYNSLGTITADPNSLDGMKGNVIRLWGHHFSGYENSGKMFSAIVNYDNQDYFNNHKTLKYYTEYGEYELEIFACVNDNPENQIVGNVDDYESNMNDVISRSMIETGVTPNDRTMILTTCTRLGSDNDPYNRISLYTKVNPIYEKTMNNSRSL